MAKFVSMLVVFDTSGGRSYGSQSLHRVAQEGKCAVAFVDKGYIRSLANEKNAN